MRDIEIYFSPAEGSAQVHHCFPYRSGLTVGDVLEALKFYQIYPQAQTYALGVFSKLVNLNTVLFPGDRIEVYRPLTRSPKERRRQKAVLKK